MTSGSKKRLKLKGEMRLVDDVGVAASDVRGSGHGTTGQGGLPGADRTSSPTEGFVDVDHCGEAVNPLWLFTETSDCLDQGSGFKTFTSPRYLNAQGNSRRENTRAAIRAAIGAYNS